MTAATTVDVGRRASEGKGGPAVSTPHGRLRAAMTEGEMLAQVRQAARLGCWLVYHTHRSDRSEAGFPDLVLARQDRLIFVELKTATGRVARAQGVWLAALQEAGVDARLVRPADLDDLLTELLERP